MMSDCFVKKLLQGKDQKIQELSATLLSINTLLDIRTKENQKFKIALIDSRAEYLNTLDQNPNCSAWNLDELTPEEQNDLRRQACETLEIEEPVLMYQFEEQAKLIKNLEKTCITWDANILSLHRDGCSLPWVSVEKQTRYREEAKDALEKLEKEWLKK
jgi:hypothetical protein